MNQIILDTFWRTAAERQEIFFRKIKGEKVLTDDQIYLQYKFCNVYRASDRVSQFLIKNVIYDKNRSEKETIFRIFLFRLLNRIETWEKLGEVELGSLEALSSKLDELKKEGPIYGNAFILCANKVFGFEEKHKNHLKLLETVFENGKSEKILNSKSLKELFLNLKELPLIGDFMAYQLAIDFNYSPIFNFDENDFTVAGPGAIRGIEKVFGKTKDYENIIYWMVENQDKEFERLGLNFKNLWGRSMKAIDVQGWFCETDKYCRVKFPELKSNRKKIKSTYRPTNGKIEYFYPPKWRIKL